MRGFFLGIDVVSELIALLNRSLTVAALIRCGSDQMRL